MAISPMEISEGRSKIGCHVGPALTLLNRPPDPVAAYTIAGLPGTPSIADMRPPIAAGPRDRHDSSPNARTSTDWAAICEAVAATRQKVRTRIGESQKASLTENCR